MFLDPYPQPTYPMSLYQSVQGKYFVGLSREEFGGGKYAWAGLFNPPDSGSLLFVNVFTVGNVTEIPFSFQVWLNADEVLVRRLIQKITVFADRFTVEFKSGLSVDINE